MPGGPLPAHANRNHLGVNAKVQRVASTPGRLIRRPAAFFDGAAFFGAADLTAGFAAGAAFFAVAMTISLIKLQKTPSRSSGGAIHRPGVQSTGTCAAVSMNGGAPMTCRF